MQPAGAFIDVIEYGGPAVGNPLPSRPKTIRLAHFAHYECFDPSYRITYRDADRYFEIDIAFGHSASAATRATALRVVNSLRAS